MANKSSNQRRAPKMSKEQVATLVMGIFTRSPKKTFNFKQISTQLLIKDQEGKNLINKTLHSLESQGMLEQVDRGKFRLKARAGYVNGSIDMTQHGYAFLISDEIE
jgi:ribonuclease R